MRTEAPIATASAFEKPATAVGCGTLRAGDQAGKLFGEALLDGVEESSGTRTHAERRSQGAFQTAAFRRCTSIFTA